MPQDPSGAQPSSAPSVFGAVGDLDFTTGFGDEDLAGAPRPATPRRTPRAPQAPAPQAPAPQAPAPQAPAPQAPAPSGSRVPVGRHPVDRAPHRVAGTPVPSAAPAPTPTAVPPTTTPAATPPTPAAVPALSTADTEVPAWARLPEPIDSTSDDDQHWFTGPGDPESERDPEALDRPSVPQPTTRQTEPGGDVAAPERAPLSRRQRRERSKPAAAASRPGRTSGSRRGAGLAGGRWKVLALRGAVYTVLTVLILSGLKNVIVSTPEPSVDQIAAQVALAQGDTGFPRVQAEAFASRFTAAYLAYDPQTAAERSAALATFSTEAASAFGLNPQGGVAQTITGGPFVVATTSTDAANGTVTISAQVNNGAWLYLAVPIYATPTGGLVVSGPPAFTAPPAAASAPAQAATVQTDSALATTLTTDVLPGFFTAWAASDTTALARYVSVDATTTATAGLAGAVTYDSLGQVSVPSGDPTARTATVQVSWTSPGVGTYLQSYVVGVVQGTDGRWYVQTLTAGALDPRGASSQVASAGVKPRG